MTFQLQDPEPDDCFQTRFLSTYRKLMEQFYCDAQKLSQGDLVEVQFEDLEQDPLGEIQRIYRELGLSYSEQFDKRLNTYLESVAGHQKNRFGDIPLAERQEIDQQLGAFMSRWGYSKLPEGSAKEKISPAA